MRRQNSAKVAFGSQEMCALIRSLLYPESTVHCVHIYKVDETIQHILCTFRMYIKLYDRIVPEQLDHRCRGYV